MLDVGRNEDERFVVASRGLSKAIQLDGSSDLTTHTPPVLTLFPRVATLRAMAFLKPPRIGLDRLIGPPAAPPPYDQVRADLAEVLQAARQGKDGLNRKYDAWAKLAEIELCKVANQDLPRMGLRGA